MPEDTKRATFGSSLVYADPKAAIEWLERAFGFKTTMVITDDANNVVHSEMSFGDGYIMVGGEWSERTTSPRKLDGSNTQSIHVSLDADIDEHCERARAAGAEIMQEPEDQFYGDRTYRAVDLEGHMWTFGQRVREVTREEAVAATGLKIEGWA